MARPRSLTNRARPIRLLVLDVDGVLTDGSLFYGAAGEEGKRFDVHDGLAMVAARRSGLAIAVISGRSSPAVAQRMKELGVVEVHQGVDDKAAMLASLLARQSLRRAEVAVMGDDLPDLPALAQAGLALAPANAVTEVKRAAHWVARHAGGAGAVREAIELILRARKSWPPKGA